MKTYTKLLIQAFRSIFDNKARSFLTMLGIAIAVFVVVAVDSISNGLAQNTNSRFSNLDPTRITVTSQEVLSTDETEEDQDENASGPGGLRQALGGSGQVQEGSESLTVEDLADIIELDNVTYASPLASSQVQTTLLDETTQRVSITGVSTSYADMEELKFASGGFFTESDENDATAKVVLDYGLAEGLFESPEEASGSTVTLADTEYTVAGVLAETDDAEAESGQRGPGGQQSTAYIPYTNYLVTNEIEEIASIVLESNSTETVDSVAESALAKIYENHGVTDETADVTISTAADALETISGITAAQSKSDKFIGWIVLLVGGIGIMNIMLVTVSERTREIGLRKAVGAKARHIVSQFLTESILLTALGGSAGLLIAISLSSKVTDIFEIQAGGPGGAANETIAIVDFNTILIALGVSVLAGVIFGLYPAIQASRKDPVESLRYE
jgi:putative ABC transport system permease protein